MLRRGHTYFINYLHYKVFTVGRDAQFATQGSLLHTTQFKNDTLEFPEPPPFTNGMELADPVNLGTNFTALSYHMAQKHPILNLTRRMISMFVLGVVSATVAAIGYANGRNRSVAHGVLPLSQQPNPESCR